MKLRIVAVNDVYSLENLPKLRTLVEQARADRTVDRVVVTVAGDFLSPSILSSLDAGRGMVDCLNEVGVDFVTFGNHEDDLAPEELLARMGELRATWLATNVRGLLPTLPVSHVLDVRGVKVGFLGVVMTDASVYRRAPFGGRGLLPPMPAALAEAKRLVEEEGSAFVVPLTHLFVQDDRALARAQADGGLPFPVVLGGHEHQPVTEQVGPTWIVKAGLDASHAVVVDLTWADGRGTTAVRLEDVTAYPESTLVRARVDQHMARVRELETATLLRIPPGEELSSVGTRSRQTSLGALLCARIRDVLGAELCLFNGGGIRASRTYRDRFTYGDLKTEVPFDNEIVVTQLPGRVIRDAIASSRAHAPKEHGGFLQVDDGVGVDASGLVVTTIGGAPLDLERMYSVALVRNLFVGLDEIEPLVRFAEEHPSQVPDADSGRDVRLVLVDAFSIALWKRLGGFDAVDLDHDDEVTASDVVNALGRITMNPSRVTAELIVNALDANKDEIITRAEADAVEQD